MNTEARLTAVRGYACDAVGCSPDLVTAVRRFEDGNRHEVYKVSLLDADDLEVHVVVRVSLGGDAAECAQAEREARVLEQMGGRAAPRLHDFRATSSWFSTPAMCMQFVPGHQQDLGSAPLDDIEGLGSVVAWVHRQPVDGLVEALGPATDIGAYAEDRLRSILGTLRWVRPPLPPAVQDRLSAAADALRRRWETARGAPSFTTGGRLAPLHGDIGPGNVLWSPDPVLIDWEYTRLGDPADEIAYLFDQNGLDPSRREAFWRNREPSYYLDHVTRRLDRLDDLSP